MLTKSVSFTIEKKHLTNDSTIDFKLGKSFTGKDAHPVNISIAQSDKNVIFMFSYSTFLEYETNVLRDYQLYEGKTYALTTKYVNQSERLNFLEIYHAQCDILFINMCKCESELDCNCEYVLRNGKKTHLQLKIDTECSEGTILYVDFKSPQIVHFGETSSFYPKNMSEKRNIMEIPHVVDIIKLVLISAGIYKPNDVYEVLGKKIRNGKLIDVDGMVKQITKSINKLSIDRLMQIDEWVKSAK